MLDGMRLEELQQQFEVPLYAFDFKQLVAALESGVEHQQALGEAA